MPPAPPAPAAAAGRRASRAGARSRPARRSTPPTWPSSAAARITIVYALLATGALLVFGLTLYGIKMTHRVAGPLHKVTLYLDKLRDGTYDAVHNLRKGDQLGRVLRALQAGPRRRAQAAGGRRRAAARGDRGGRRRPAWRRSRPSWPRRSTSCARCSPRRRSPLSRLRARSASVSNYLLNKSLQLRYVALVTALSAIITGSLGFLIWRQELYASRRSWRPSTRATSPRTPSSRPRSSIG